MRIAFCCAGCANYRFHPEVFAKEKNMKRIACILAAFGLIAAAATPAWAHHSHHGHYHGGYYGHTYNSYCNGYVSQGDAWDAQGNYDSAISAYTQAIAYDTNCALAYAQRGAVWYEKGEYEKAIADDTQAIALDHNFAAAYNNRSAAWDAKNEFDKGIADANQALAITPSFVEAYVSRGALWYNKGEYDKAIADANQALAINPSFAQAYSNRAAAWDMKGEYEKAKADYYQAIAIDSNCAAYYNDLAFFQATCLDPHYRDAKRAFENASKAYQLSNGNNADNNFSVLASAYAENGDFDQALQWQGKAIDLTKDAQMKQRYLARVELFKQGKPFRFDPKTALQNPVAAD
jgi:tetratricopeptide (TPR) repeat protein